MIGESENPKIKVTMIGDSGVGKSSISSRAVDDYFDPEKAETVGTDITNITKEYQSKKLDMMIWDTAGQERYKSLSNYYLKDSKAVIIVYAINDLSFQSVDQWYEKAIDILSNIHPYIILVANKNDLYDDENNNQILISEEEGRNKAYRLGIDFLSVSALTGDCISSIFESIAQFYFTKEKHDEVPTVTVKEYQDTKKDSCC